MLDYKNNYQEYHNIYGDILDEEDREFCRRREEKPQYTEREENILIALFEIVFGGIYVVFVFPFKLLKDAIKKIKTKKRD